MATMIASQAQSGIQPRALHAGVNSVYAIYSLTATLSAGDIIQMCKLPDRARVVDAILASDVNLAPNATALLNLGNRDDHDCLIASATISAHVMFRLNVAGAIGKQFDVSDDATTRYTMIEIAISDFTGTGTKSGAISLNLTYQIDQ